VDGAELIYSADYDKESVKPLRDDRDSAEMKVFKDMIEDGRTGLGYPWMENEHLGEIIESAVMEPRNILQMKENCLKKAESYIPENLIKILLQEMS
jgi:hypothetical protein